jgi:thymidylate synthase
MKQYLAIMSKIMNEGVMGPNRTGVPDKALFGHSYKVVLNQEEDGTINGFPLLTTKKVSLKKVFIELMWKLSGSTNIQPLLKQKVHIWTEWPFGWWLRETKQVVKQFTDDSQQTLTDEWEELKKQYETMVLNDDDFATQYGEIGKTYGHNFRNFGEIRDSNNILIIPGKDQVTEALNRIMNKPEDRRIIISLWDPQTEHSTLLPPCPCFYQFNARVPGSLDLNLYQRSCDYFLGVPYNTAQDSLMLCLFSHVTGKKPREFTHMFGDVHLYHNHFDVAREQLSREPRELPSLRIKKDTNDLFSIKWEDIEVLNYNPHPALKGQVAV